MATIRKAKTNEAKSSTATIPNSEYGLAFEDRGDLASGQQSRSMADRHDAEGEDRGDIRIDAEGERIAAFARGRHDAEGEDRGDIREDRGDIRIDAEGERIVGGALVADRASSIARRNYRDRP